MYGDQPDKPVTHHGFDALVLADALVTVKGATFTRQACFKSKTRSNWQDCICGELQMLGKQQRRD